MIDLVSRPLELLPRSELMPTSEVDHPHWNYRPLLGPVQRLRFRIILKLLADAHFGTLLEIGYGSGVFMPELAKRSDNLYGIDPHPKHREVTESLARNGINAALTQATVESLPYESDFFDCAVAVSTLEYVPGIDDACRELRRVLKPTGMLVVVTPGATPLWDLALRLTTGESPAQYSDRRQNLQPALRREFEVTREVRVPAFGASKLRLYTGLSLRLPAC
jgi:SAM-dependent methyltransferase